MNGKKMFKEKNMREIPLVNPYLPPERALISKLTEVLYSGYIAEGKYVQEFEEKLSSLIGNPYCLALSSGTAALHIALELIGIKEGDEVISTALTAEPTNTTIMLKNAKVVFADVDLNTGLILPESIESLINERTKAIMVVHYAGMVCDMDKINSISEKYKIPVIEDAAHALLSKYKEHYVGYNSRYTCFSFQAIKHLTTVDGGMLFLNNSIEYERARKLRWFGLDKKIPRLDNDITEAGYKYNMNNVNAAIGLVQLEYLTDNVFKYINNGQYYDKELKNVEGISLINYYENTEPSYWLYTLKVKNRDGFVKMLDRKSVV